ncbi:MAG: type II secretion system protein [Candidatus Paceibacterota bacterium]|jgi:prepilin-type N-terminal cleavage/methylation domain-containing protein
MLLKQYAKTSKTGFTLIELLVVIAIIGILAGMVVINMQGAPNSAKDATIKGYFSQMMPAAMIFKTVNNTYVGVDVAGQEFKTLLDKANESNGTGSVYSTTSAAGGAGGVTAYCAKAQLVVDNTQYWCVDSTGFTGTTTAAQCSATDLTCQ